MKLKETFSNWIKFFKNFFLWKVTIKTLVGIYQNADWITKQIALYKYYKSYKTETWSL